MYSLLLAIIYLAFIGLGLPDSLLGAAWPAIHTDLNIPVSFAGLISMIIAAGTIFSSLMSDRSTRLLGTGKVTALSVGITALALYGFSTADSLLALCLWAVPYGLGAGSVDASINNYVALHYKNTHMNWLHCMWGVGATAGPYIMGYTLSQGLSWNNGYLTTAIIQAALTAILVLSLPLWVKNPAPTEQDQLTDERLILRQVVALPGTKILMLTFFGYCALEQTTILWAASYFADTKGFDTDDAATAAGLFFIGLTAGRAASGLIAMKLNDTTMIRLGLALTAAGTLTLVLPHSATALIGLTLLGLGCAPIYPSIIHSIPQLFGPTRSQAIIGIQMAAAYTGTLTMPPLFGLISSHTTIHVLPLYLLILVTTMTLAHHKLIKTTQHTGTAEPH